MDHSCQTVTVLSRNYSTGLGVIRSLGAAGYTVDLIASTKKKGSSVIAASSRYVRRTVEVLSPDIQTDDGARLVEALIEYGKAAERKPVLFPTDDFTASVAAKNRELLQEYFLLPYVTDKAGRTLVQTMDKTVQSALADKAGLMTPTELTVSLRGEISLPAAVPYPCFVKPLASIAGHKTEMAVCADAAELVARLAAMKKRNPDRSVLVQEYLHITKEYDLSALCLDEKVIVPAIIEKTRIAQHERGVTLSGRVLPPDILGEAAHGKITDFLRSLHYVGMADMELNLCGDKLYFGEVNLRSGGPNFAYCLSGVNLPDLFVREITGRGHKPSEECVRQFGTEFVYEKVAWEDCIFGYMPRSELKSCLKKADHTLLANASDPKPGKIFKRRIRLSALKHRLKMLLGLEKRGKADKAKPRVVLTGRNYGNLLCIARALGKAGYAVEVLRLFKTKPSPLNLLRRMKPEAKSRYVNAYRELILGDDPEAFADCLISLADGDKPLLLPTDDYSAYAVDEALDRLKEHYTVPNIAGTKGGIIALMDKNEQKKRAVQFAVPLLQSRLIRSDDGSFTIPDGIVYPCFVKPNVSMKSTKAQMCRCDDETALNEVLTVLGKSGGFEVLCEQYAEIRCEYSVLGASAGGKVVAPCVFKTTRGGHRERKGVALTGETLAADALGEITGECVKLVQSLDYTGLFDIDLIETVDGGIYFTELNFRAGASIHAFTESGVNLPAMLADCLVKGAPLNENCRVYASGKSFVGEKVLMEELARGDISLREARRLVKSADIHFVYDSADKKPYRCFRKYYHFAILLRIPYRMRRR